MSNQIVPLSSLSVNGKGAYGIAASAVPYAKDKYTYLRITDINDDGTLNIDDLKSVDDPDACNYVLQPNDIVFARTGASTGRNYFYDGSDGTFVYAGFLIKFSIDPNKVNPLYVKYFCQSQKYRDWIYSFNTGSTRGNINERTLAQMPIELPSRRQQDLLVENLSKIDAKIKLNNQINRNLEEQAQAIFKNWFVDFEPFGGEMPRDWKLGKLGDVAEIKKKAFHPEKNPGLIVEHYSLPALDEKHYPVFEVADGIKSNKFVVSKESVLISKLNPDTKRIWRPYCISENPICSTEFVVFESINGSHRDFLYSIIDSWQFYDFMGSLVTGCTNSHQRVSPETLLTFPIAIPPKTILKSFCDKITPIYEMIEKNVLENQRLANLRDSTLPKLMSGEIDSDKIAV